MARLVLDGPVGFPVGHLADTLRKVLPLVRWQVGDGAQEGVVALDRPASLFGRADDAFILLGVELVPAPLGPAIPAPPHRAHVRLTGPSTDDPEVAHRLLLIVGDALVWQAGGALQPVDDGPWYGRDTLADGMARLSGEPSAGLFQVRDFLSASTPVPVGDGAKRAVDGDIPTPQSFPRGRRDKRPLFGRKGL